MFLRQHDCRGRSRTHCDDCAIQRGRVLSTSQVTKLCAAIAQLPSPLLESWQSDSSLDRYREIRAIQTIPNEELGGHQLQSPCCKKWNYSKALLVEAAESWVQYAESVRKELEALDCSQVLPGAEIHQWVRVREKFLKIFKNPTHDSKRTWELMIYLRFTVRLFTMLQQRPANCELFHQNMDSDW